MSISDRQYIRGGLNHWLNQGLPVVMLTVTEGADPRDFVGAGDALRQLVDDLRYLHGGPFPYVAVAEPQKRGAVHWHLLMAGFRYPIATRSAKDGRRWPGHSRTGPGVTISKEKLRPLLTRHGFGGFVGLRAVGVTDRKFLDELGESAGIRMAPEDLERMARERTLEGTSKYLAKYLTKSWEELDIPPGRQPLRHSRGDVAWWPGRTLQSLRHGGPDRPPTAGELANERARTRSRELSAEMSLARAFGIYDQVGIDPLRAARLYRDSLSAPPQGDDPPTCGCDRRESPREGPGGVAPLGRHGGALEDPEGPAARLPGTYHPPPP